MNKIGDFLYKLFGAVLVFFCYVYDNNANAKVICPDGKYVSRCGDYYVGTNWLKGYTVTKTLLSSDGSTESTYTLKTTDYFDYSSNADEVNLANMRKLFEKNGEIIKKNGDIIYTEYSDDANAQIMNSAKPDEYGKTRDDILEKYCNPNNVYIECAACAGNGTVGKSEYDKGWKSFKTIADCYMKEYTDTTGTYVNISKDNQEQNCYFTAAVQYVGGNSLPGISQTSQYYTAAALPVPSETITNENVQTNAEKH